MSNLPIEQDRLQINYPTYQPTLSNASQESDVDKFRRFFYNRAQEQSETVEEYVSELQRLAQGGRFDMEMHPSNVEKLIVDRFVEGLKSQQVQEFVMNQIRTEKVDHGRDVSLPKLLEIVKTLEAEELEDEDDDMDDDDEEEEEMLNYQPSTSTADNTAGGSSGHHHKDVEIKREHGHDDDESSKGYVQQYPTSARRNSSASSSGSEPSEKLSSFNDRLRSEHRQLSCEHCGFKCFSKYLLSSHALMAHNQESKSSGVNHHKCPTCQAVFLSRIGLDTHQIMLHQKSKDDLMKRIMPPEVIEPFPMLDDEPFRELDDYIYYDDIVGNSRNGRLDPFEMEDLKTRSFVCEVCQYRTTTASQLRKHMSFFHADTEVNHQCKDCPYIAVTEEALVRHVAQNHSKTTQRKQRTSNSNRWQPTQKFHCELCEFVTIKKTELQKHLTTVHRGSKVYMCETCGKKFQTDKTLEVHHRVVHLNQKPFACKLCDYKAGQKASLISHHHSVHENNKPFVCETCGYKTTSQSTLNAHKRMVHEKQRPYVCDHCGRSFAARAGMENHILLIHEKQTPFACDRCGKKFKRRPDLNNHIRCIHENNYYVCNVCNNSFQTARNLERHVTTVHEQMKPFECSTCGQAFARRERLKHHIERNHGGGGGLSGLSPTPQLQHPGAATTPASVIAESHHSNMASPHVPPSPQNLVMGGGAGVHDHFGVSGLGQYDQLLEHHHRSLQSHHVQTHPMLLLVQQQQQQQQQLQQHLHH